MISRYLSRGGRPALLASAIGWLFLSTMGASAQAYQSTTASSEDSAANGVGTVVTLAGRVVDAISGGPVREANLTITVFASDAGAGGRGRRPSRFSTTSDAQGNFLFDNLPPGQYQLSGDKTGYVRSNYGADRSRAASPLEGAPGKKITGIDFQLMPQAIIAGRILNEFGEPMANAQVRLMRLTGYFRKATGGAGGGMTNAVGEFLLGNLAPGRYVLVADYRTRRFGRRGAAVEEQKDDSGYLPTYYPGTTEEEAASAISVKAGQQVRGIDLWLQKGEFYRVSGRVSGDTSTEGSGRLRILLRPEQGGAFMVGPGFGGAATRADATFEISDVQPGSYILTALSFGGNMRPQTLTRVPVSVTDHDIEGIVIPGTPHPPATITGKITMEGSSNTVPRATVSLQPLGLAMPFRGRGSGLGNGNRNGDVRIQPDGTFTIENVPAGKYDLQVSPQDSGYVKSITAGGADVLKNGIDLSEGSTVPPVEIVINPKSGTIEGTVKQGDEPQPGAYVTLLPDPLPADSQRLRISTTSDDGGHFSFQGVAPGDYLVYAWQERFPLRIIDAADLQPYTSFGASATVEESAKKQVELQVVPLP